MPQDRAGAVKGTQSSNAGHGEGMPRVNQNYLDYVRSFAAPTKHFHNCLRAFTVGGGICCIGQFIRIMLENWAHLSGDELAGTVSVVLIFFGCLLTGLGVYDRIGKAAGAGSIVPITGFANSVAAPVIEFRREGMIMGVGARLFQLAGPVLVYGITSSVVVGVIYWAVGRWFA